MAPYLVLAAVTLALFGIRLAGPPNLRDNDQERPASYVLDITQNGNWICQRDYWGRIASKPPMYTWLSATATLVTGNISLFTLYLPGALAAAGTACLIFWAGLRFFDQRTAWLAALMHLLSGTTLKQLTLARTDGVFAFFVTATALAAWLALTGRTSWIYFWLLAAAATLTKGPLGVVFAAGGLLSALWRNAPAEELERWRSVLAEPPRSRHKGHLLGVLLYLLLSAGWLYLAYAQYGDPVIDKLFRKELVGHVVTAKKTAFPGAEFYQPPLFFLSRYAPWSILAVIGLWRVWRRPAVVASEQRFERFLLWWFLFGLVLLSISTHQRADLLWPLYPAAALLAGREVARLTRRWSNPTLTRAAGAATVLALIIVALLPSGNSRTVQQTIALKNFANEVRQKFGSEIPFVYVDAPFTLQFYLNTMQRHMSVEQARKILDSPEPVYVLLDGKSNFLSQLTGPGKHVVRTVTAEGEVVLHVVSNTLTFSPAKAN